ncbi:MAG: ParB/RepB/Spo0J family partition protein [Chitinivibrionia bacterium]|nr:ParB/RepB/Spo0J family partition protein [Chitinivibrionia bacterium]
MSRKALGKGLSILYGESEAQESNASQTAISISQIEPNPFQPRIDFDNEQIEELAKSIKEQGLLQPIVVRKTSDDKYQIVSGERRFRALKLLNEKEIAAIIREDVDDKQMLELALVENIQRENLNEIETALSYKKLIEFCGYSHQELSDRLGKSRALITNTLRLLKLSEDIQTMLREKQISAGHAKVLLAVENPILQLQLAQEVVKKTLSVRETEKKLSQVLSGDDKEKVEISAKKETILASKYSSVLSDIKNLRGFELKIIEEKSGKSGKVEIKFANTDEFEKIITILSKDNVE